MAFFGKHGRPDEGKDEAATQPQEKPTKKKRAKDMMESVLSESVMESALDDMRANKACIAERNGEKIYVGLFLNTEDIGGLNKKSIKDEDKGQIIELINAGHIHTYIPRSLLEAECFVIIPDAVTLACMDEFTLLTGAHYTVAFTKEDGSVEDTEVAVDYARMSAVVQGDEDIMDLLADLGFDFAQPEVKVDDDDGNGDAHLASEVTAVMDSGSNDEVDADSEFEDEIPDDDFEDGDSEPDFDDSELTDDDAGDDSDDAVVDGDAESEAPAADIEFDDEDNGEAEAEEPETAPEQEEVVDMKQFDAAITRRFYSDDLGLEVTTEPFDAQFLHTNPYIPFEEHRPDGWFNNYLNEMCRDANLAMKRLHQDNLFAMRDDYYKLISMHCEQIQKELDPQYADGTYGQMLAGIEKTRHDKHESEDREINRRKEEIESAWDMALKHVGEEAMVAAQQQYRERFGQQHQDELFRIEPSVRADIENEYQDAIRDMNNRRRDEASRRMDYGVTETLKNVTEKYMKCLEDETAEYKAWRDKINTFIDEHRKDDIAHDKALADELAQSEKADKVLAEYTEKLNAQAADFAAKAESLRNDIEVGKIENEKRIKQLNAEHDERVAKLNDENAKLQSRIDDLLAKYAQLDEKKAGEFEQQIQALKDANAAADVRYDQLVAVHKKSNIVSVALTIVGVIAACAIGIIVGSTLNLSFGSSKASDSVVQEFNDRMDNVDKKNSDTSSKQNDRMDNVDKKNSDTSSKQNAGGTSSKSTSTTDGAANQ
jgi:aspartate 1-decarboxylase